MKTVRPITRFRGPYFFLSNFSPCQIIYDGIVYPTLEHAYQAAKTADVEEKLEISKQPTPGRAKRAGRRATQMPEWDRLKVMVMYDLLNLKFNYRPMSSKLAQTNPRELIEGNDWGDTFWGVCNGRGYNMLGQLLMITRGEIVASGRP